MKRPSTGFIVTLYIIVAAALAATAVLQAIRIDAYSASEYRRGFHDGAEWQKAMSKRYPKQEETP